MAKESGIGGLLASQGIFKAVRTMMRLCLLWTLSSGPIPNHIAFIMDGNRRYAKKRNLEEGAGHRAGFYAFMSLLKYSYVLGVKYVTAYAFSIDNFKRDPEEVKMVMDLMVEKMEGFLEEDSFVNQYGIRVFVVGNLKLLSEPIRAAAEKVMTATAKNNKATLTFCVAYTSTNEIVHAVEESCKDKLGDVCALLDDGSEIVKLVDVEKRMYMAAVAPDPDVVIRSSGETRLSNFLLWQTTNCALDCHAALWPEVGFWHLVWAILNFQRTYAYFEKKKKHM